MSQRLGPPDRAVVAGVYDGLSSWRPRPSGLPDHKDVKSFPTLYKAGYLLGTAIHGIAVIVLGSNIL